MQVSVDIPDSIAAELTSDGRRLERAILESLAIEGVRSGRLSRWQIKIMLGFDDGYELDGFLKLHDVPKETDIEEIRRQSDFILSHRRPD